MSKGGVGSHPGSIPGFTVETFGRRNSSDASFSDASSDLKDVGGTLASPTTPLDEKKNSSLTNVFGGRKRFNDEVFKPSFHYDNLVLPDIGGTLADETADEISSVPTSGSSSSASSISIPEPAAKRSEGSQDPRRNSHDMV
jgi:pheromone a factor receptor